MKKNYKLTSVHILERLYRNFKKKVVNADFTLQKLVNRSIYLYLTDNVYQNTLDNTTRGYDSIYGESVSGSIEL